MDKTVKKLQLPFFKLKKPYKKSLSAITMY